MTSIFRRKGRKGWTLKYRDGSGVDRFRSFPTKDQAEDESHFVRQHPSSGEKILFKDYAQRWLASVALHVRPSTIHGYKWAMKTKAIPELGHVALRDLSRARIRELADRLLAAGLARHSVLGVVGTVRSCLQTAVDDGLLAANPATRQGRSRAFVRAINPAEQIKALDAGQLGKFLIASATEPDYALLFRLLALTGLRLGEALGLQWDDLDLAGRSALIRRGVSRNVVHPTKTGRSRNVDLALGLVEHLTAWDAKTKAIALQRGTPRAPWVFASRLGGTKDHKYAEAAFKRVLLRAALPPYHTPHDLRHTYASLQLQRGASAVYVQRQLGHATLSITTGLYGRWLPMGNSAAADALEAVVTGVAPSTSVKDA